MRKNIEQWIKCAGIRAIKTIAQTAIATIGTNVAMGDVNWIIVGSTSLLAGIQGNFIKYYNFVIFTINSIEISLLFVVCNI